MNPKAMWFKAVRAARVWLKARRMRKASRKCEYLIMLVQTHLSIQKNRRFTIMKQSRADIAQLLQNGSLHHALSRVEQLYKDKCQLAAYDLIEKFCECIITNLSDICKHSCVQNLPMNVTEAIASVICAASRCGELQQLHLIRRLFRERYGREFDADNVELRAGNFVNSQLKQNLCIKVVPENEKLKLIEEIAPEHTLYLRFRELKQHFNPQLQNQYHALEQEPGVMDIEMHGTCSNNDEMTQRKVIATPSLRHFRHSYTKSSSSSEGLNSVKVEYQEAVSARTLSSEGMPRAPNMSSIVYLGDDDDNIEEEEKKKHNLKMEVKNHRSLYSSIDKWK